MANKNVITIGGVNVFGHFLVKTWMDDNALMIGFFDRSKSKVQSVAASLGSKQGKWNWSKFQSKNDDGWSGLFQPVFMQRDRFLYCVATNKEIGTKYLLTTQEEENNDLYNYLMNHYKLPLLKWWIPYIKEALLTNRIIINERLAIVTSVDSPIFISLNGKHTDLRELVCFDFNEMSNECFTEIVSDLLQRKVIWITKSYMEPLSFETFDDYISKYGPSLVDNLNSLIEPLSPLKPNVDTLALKNKNLFPQQAACVNGVLAMRKKGIHYAILNEGMGVGKVRRCGVRYDCNWNVA